MTAPTHELTADMLVGILDTATLAGNENWDLRRLGGRWEVRQWTGPTFDLDPGARSDWGTTILDALKAAIGHPRVDQP